MPEGSSPMPERNQRVSVGIGMAVAGLVIIGIIMGVASGVGSNNPEDYLRENYNHVSGDDPDSSNGIVLTSNDSATQTANAFYAGTESDGRREEGGTHYLRYDSDWMVTVDDETSGSEIKLYEFDRGYTQHSSAVGVWSVFYNRDSGGGFRGGGSGFGK